MRIQLKAGLALVRRGPGCVQVGLEERHGALLDGLTDADLGLIDQLARGLDVARLAGPDADDARSRRERTLIGLLTDTGVLLRARADRSTMRRLGPRRPRLSADAAAWALAHPAAGDGWQLMADRSRAVVEIEGAGRVGLTLAGTLAAAGVGAIRVNAPGEVGMADVCPAGALPDDVGLGIPDAARNVVDRGRADPPGAPDRAAERQREPGRPPDLVVLIDRLAADSTRADRLLAADVSHLSVVVRETTVLVGPLVRPGLGPCLRCLDLHRSDRDRQWPLVLAQLLAAAGRRLPQEETAISQLAASLAALQVLCQLDGLTVPAAVGATLEVELPDGLIARRPWPAHPSCGCTWPPGGPTGDATTEPPDQDGHPVPPAATMLQ
jgi:hypothetical protein